MRPGKAELVSSLSQRSEPDRGRWMGTSRSWFGLACTCCFVRVQVPLAAAGPTWASSSVASAGPGDRSSSDVECLGRLWQPLDAERFSSELAEACGPGLSTRHSVKARLLLSPSGLPLARQLAFGQQGTEFRGLPARKPSGPRSRRLFATGPPAQANPHIWGSETASVRPFGRFVHAAKSTKTLVSAVRKTWGSTAMSAWRDCSQLCSAYL